MEDTRHVLDVTERTFNLRLNRIMLRPDWLIDQMLTLSQIKTLHPQRAELEQLQVSKTQMSYDSDS